MRRFSSFIWIVTVLWLDSAIAQVAEVTGFIGDDVLMPCFSPSPNVNVYWRDKDDKVLLDVIDGVHDPTTQHHKFRGRVLSPPDQNQKGNFSIVLQKLQRDDAGAYDCNIPSKGVERSYRLVVTDKPVPASTPPAPAVHPRSSSPPPPAGNAALSLAPPLLLLLLGSAWQRQ